ncbi:MAG: hypothetical protein U0Q12_11165 [Vicinamibacterales bacterium]
MTPVPANSASTAVGRRHGGVARAAVVICLLAVAIALQAWRDRAFPPADPVTDVLYVTSGPLLDRLALSFDPLVADLYWIRAVQHFGGTRRSHGPKRYELLYPLLDLTTSLDPRYSIAYRFGSVFLAEPPPGGPGRPDLAIALLEKGIAATPDRWQYQHDIGFIYYWWYRDYRKAAEWFDKAASAPGAPWWLRSVAATTLAQGGDRQSSRALWRLLAETAESEWLRNDAIRRLLQLDALDEIEALTSVVATYRQRGGAPPLAWRSLVATGLLRDVPRDPAGTPYVLGPYSGTVDVDDASPLAPLPSPMPPPSPAPDERPSSEPPSAPTKGTA